MRRISAWIKRYPANVLATLDALQPHVRDTFVSRVAFGVGADSNALVQIQVLEVTEAHAVVAVPLQGIVKYRLVDDGFSRLADDHVFFIEPGNLGIGRIASALARRDGRFRLILF